jgi:hypothetical protein
MRLPRLGTVCRCLLISALLTGLSSAQPVGAKGNIPLPVDELVRRLGHEEFEVLSSKRTGKGTTGARKLKLRFEEDGFELDVKWKAAPAKEGWNNSPRREIAAYLVQGLVFDPDDYVVPPSALRCIPLSEYREVAPKPPPGVGKDNCVFGLLSVWMQNVKQPKKLLDKKRFGRDPAYSRRVADLNILTYLIRHQDSRKSNFLISKVQGNPQLFVIDNDITFQAEFRNPFVRHWTEIVVPALPRESIERLRRVEPSQLEHLGVVSEFARDGQGVWNYADPSPNWDPAKGVREQPDAFQFGLKRAEIDDLAMRIRKLLAQVDEGKIELF